MFDDEDNKVVDKLNIDNDYMSVEEIKSLIINLKLQITELERLLNSKLKKLEKADDFFN